MTECRDTDISETWILGILTRSLTPAYNVMKEDLTNHSPVYQSWRRHRPIRVQDSDISIMYWLTNWVTVCYNEIQTAPQQKWKIFSLLELLFNHSPISACRLTVEVMSWVVKAIISKFLGLRDVGQFGDILVVCTTSRLNIVSELRT